MAAGAQNFTQLQQVAKTEWTIAGIVASQCGFPLVVNHRLSNTSLASISDPFAGQQCLGDILDERGYRTVFMGGADHAFGGKGNFLSTHGYQQVLGLEELRASLADPDYLNGWGLFDDSLFELAGQKLRELEEGEQPWMLTLLTVDTHFPNGHASKSCRPLSAEATSIENAIYCSDQLISGFIRQALQELDMRETIVVLFSDHLTMRNELWTKLAPLRDQRTLMFMVFTDQPGAARKTPGSHFDVAPTVLELAGVGSPVPLGMGVSLLAEAALARNTLPAYGKYRSVTNPLGDNPSVLDAGLTFGAADMSLNIGDLKLLPNESGRPFEEGMFLLAFNPRGQVAEIIFSNNFPELLENHANRLVAGVSLFKGDPGPLSFYGRLSGDPADIVQKPLLNDIQVTPEELSRWLDGSRQKR